MNSNTQINNNYNNAVLMPNEIFNELNSWSENKELKTVHHKEFVYSFCWYIAYLWRYAIYGEQEINLMKIKQTLGYNPNEKRIDYIIKRNGLLDEKGYTDSTNSFPVGWSLNGEGLSFSMLDDFDDVSKQYLLKGYNENRLIKAPLKHIGTEDEEGIFWNSPNTHMVNLSIFEKCMSNSELGCSGFYMYGLLSYIDSLSKHFNEAEDYFVCSNETLTGLTGWGIRKVIKVTNSLVEFNLIEKEQRIKIKGNVNHYGINYDSY